MTDDLIHMKRKPQTDSEVMSGLESKPAEYPYGLEIRLSEEEMGKLGIDPKVGETVHIMAMATVTACSAHASENDKGQNCTLQLTHMKAEVEDTEEEDEEDDRTPAEKIYGKKK